VARRRLTGVLLVGGASRRFGSPKALARLGGETLAERAWRILGDACDERIAVGKLADALQLPFPIVDDAGAGRHPAVGIVTGLRSATNEICVFLPVDCPSMTPEALRMLGDACADAAVPTTRDPLPGAYARRALPALERALNRDGSIRAALDDLDVRWVDVDPRLLANVNTPAELEALRRVTQTPPTA
jgi:molybdopterin-guanine dinucleotide biosynthesis protein A